jgi:hypothetical protein
MLEIIFLGWTYDVEVLIRLPRSHCNHGIHFRGLIETAESAFAVTLIPRKLVLSNNYLEFFGEFESIFETALV